MSDLATTQRWMQHAITGVGLESQPPPEAVVRGSGGLDAAERVGLYRVTYQRRLTGCLRDSFPGLRHALGDELFDDFALDYVSAQPSRSYTLAALGAGWPAHLEATRPDRDAPAAERERWPDFLVDLARLERTFFEVYDGPGTEGERLPAAADLPAQPCDDATVTPVACLRLEAARFPVGPYLVAVRRGEDPPLPAPAASFMAVSRRDWVVTITELDATGHALLRELLAGATLARAALTAGVAVPGAWKRLREWADHGLIAGVQADGRGRSTKSMRGAVA